MTSVPERTILVNSSWQRSKKTFDRKLRVERFCFLERINKWHPGTSQRLCQGWLGRGR